MTKPIIELKMGGRNHIQLELHCWVLQHWLSAVFRPEVQDCVRARCSLEVSRESDCNNAKAIGKRSWVARAGDDHSSVKEGSLSIISLLL